MSKRSMKYFPKCFVFCAKVAGRDRGSQPGKSACCFPERFRQPAFDDRGCRVICIRRLRDCLVRPLAALAVPRRTSVPPARLPPCHRPSETVSKSDCWRLQHSRWLSIRWRNITGVLPVMPTWQNTSGCCSLSIGRRLDKSFRQFPSNSG